MSDALEFAEREDFFRHVSNFGGWKQMVQGNVESRLEAFEKMLAAVQENYDRADCKMKQLKAEGREKSATYRQMMGSKLQYQNMLSMYRLYGLIGETVGEE